MTAPTPGPGWPAPDPEPDLTPKAGTPADRGTLVIERRAVERIVSRALRDAGAGDGAGVSVDRLEDGLELSTKVSLPYPHHAMSASIEPVRRSVVECVARLVGRPVERLDMEVVWLTVPAPPPTRRVR